VGRDHPLAAWLTTIPTLTKVIARFFVYSSTVVMDKIPLNDVSESDMEFSGGLNR
jgi:hypothetical protein